MRTPSLPWRLIALACLSLILAWAVIPHGRQTLDNNGGYIPICDPDAQPTDAPNCPPDGSKNDVPGVEPPGDNPILLKPELTVTSESDNARGTQSQGPGAL